MDNQLPQFLMDLAVDVQRFNRAEANAERIIVENRDRENDAADDAGRNLFAPALAGCNLESHRRLIEAASSALACMDALEGEQVTYFKAKHLARAGNLLRDALTRMGR